MLYYLLNTACLYVAMEIIVMIIGVCQVAYNDANPVFVMITCAICFICLHKLSATEITLPNEKPFDDDAPALKKIIFKYTNSKEKTNKIYAYIKKVSSMQEADWRDAIDNVQTIDEGGYFVFAMQKGFSCVLRAVYRNGQWQILENPFGSYANDLTIVAYDKHSFITIDEALSRVNSGERN